MQKLCIGISHLGGFYLNHVCLGNMHIDQEIDAGTQLLQNITKMMARWLNALTTLSRSSTHRAEDQPHWFQPIRLQCMVR